MKDIFDLPLAAAFRLSHLQPVLSGLSQYHCGVGPLYIYILSMNFQLANGQFSLSSDAWIALPIG